MASKRGGRASAAMTALVLATYGLQCHLRLKGCTGVATTKDHLVPYSHGGEDVLENYRPACRSCNSRRQNKVMTGYGASVVVLIGPPAGGKTTYLLEHAKPNDVQIDMDAICRALMPIAPTASHDYPEHVRHIGIKARAAAVHHATRLRERVTVWLIHAIPKPDDLADYKRMGWQVITVDPGREVVESRARRERPEQMMHQVARWYATYGVPVIEPDAPPVALTSTGRQW
ncbi:HNH endonuclease [Microterricola viridarii]|uniref:HNH nuclease domain-containing protein n=1 Tax=Microterricola viridarii TaxID=412690 RepID=A0A0X8E0U5_9MICO|nr:HNH endonuclease [Microterricola viridarii]AMB58246.1 hypothetical protein AWU67_04585 [Microterricola viridarii]